MSTRHLPTLHLSVRHLSVPIVAGACVLSLALGAPARAEEPDSMSFGAPADKVTICLDPQGDPS